jgi:glycerol-3-phosphate acyltransferase PlsY
MGRRWGVAVAALDGAKGWIAVDLAARVTGGDERRLVFSALCAVAGHVWSVWLGFRGGKGVITTGGAFLRLAPWPIAIAAAAFGISAGSLAAAIALPAAAWLLPGAAGSMVRVASLAAAVLVAWRHRANVNRILAGVEPRFGGTGGR